MFSSLLSPSSRSRPDRTHNKSTPSPLNPSRYRGWFWGQASNDDEEDVDAQGREEQEEDAGSTKRRAQHHDDEDTDSAEDGEEEDEDGDEQEHLLPISSAEMLDKIPIYSLTHSVRILVLQRCETTLSWDQLRSPQISQFLVKPIQQSIRSSHLNRATLYALVTNALQFNKEGQLNPATVGVSRTRALLCELLALRLLKEYSTRELIDALSYGFDPLQGTGRNSGVLRGGMTTTGPARISTIEVAIRAPAKKLLAHPLVVQQLEAIWAGNIVFHSAADYLHRPPEKQPRDFGPHYGSIDRDGGRFEDHRQIMRRTAVLYNPADSSPFKLSRLRVPRYRQMSTTCSFAVMLGLFLAVLLQRSVEITALEVLFWFWSAGYMLDEIVGLTEEGFGLYIISIWNAFDIGILLLFFAYYALRLYGIIVPTARKTHTAGMAYDVLASTAVLLFPRLFSVLDHYKYFSQLLIAFRMMALDLAAILVLILITCSGFFVAFTVAFPTNEDFTASKAAYTLFQTLMGFTPAVWDIWGSYNVLGKAILILFLCIAHFLIVTILITVLTNSFMAVVANANEEHQYLFAINTLSMVKSDALFSYIAPTNTFGWLMRPLKYVMPLRKYVRLNRTVIKATHFPLLWTIFVYERIVLTSRMYEATDLVEQRGRTQAKLPAFSLGRNQEIFSPRTRLREPSVATYQKDRALDEVFRRPFQGATRHFGRSPLVSERKQTVVNDWMRKQDDEGGADEPPEQSRSVVDRLESRMPSLRRLRAGDVRFHRRHVRRPMSTTSDQQDLISHPTLRRPNLKDFEASDHASEDDKGVATEDGSRQPPAVTASISRSTPATEQHHASSSGVPSQHARLDPQAESMEEYFTINRAPSEGSLIRGPESKVAPTHDLASSFDTAKASPVNKESENGASRQRHTRTASTTTVILSPIEDTPKKEDKAPFVRLPTTSYSELTQKLNPQAATTPKVHSRSAERPASNMSNASKALAAGIPQRKSEHQRTGPKVFVRAETFSGGQQTSNRHIRPRTRPVMPAAEARRTAPASELPSLLRAGRGRVKRMSSFTTAALDLASDLGDNKYRPDTSAAWQNMPASFSTQLQAADLKAMIDREWRYGDSSRKQRNVVAANRGSRRSIESTSNVDVTNDSEANDNGDDDDDDNTQTDSEHARRMSRIMLNRMASLEQGFRDVLDEVRGWRQQDVSWRGGVGTRTAPTTAPGSFKDYNNT